MLRLQIQYLSRYVKSAGHLGQSTLPAPSYTHVNITPTWGWNSFGTLLLCCQVLICCPNFQSPMTYLGCLTKRASYIVEPLRCRSAIIKPRISFFRNQSFETLVLVAIDHMSGCHSIFSGCSLLADSGHEYRELEICGFPSAPDLQYGRHAELIT